MPELYKSYFVLYKSGSGGVRDNLIVRLIKRWKCADSMLPIRLVMFYSYQVKMKTIQQRIIQHHQIKSFQKYLSNSDLWLLIELNKNLHMHLHQRLTFRFWNFLVSKLLSIFWGFWFRFRKIWSQKKKFWFWKIWSRKKSIGFGFEKTGLADSTVAGKCTVDGKDNKEDKTREEADMTLFPNFPKVSKAVQKWSKRWVTIKNSWNMYLDHSRTLLDTFWPLLKILEKTG